MPGFTTFQEYKDAVLLRNRYRIFHKTPTTQGTQVMNSLWAVPGIPPAGSFPTTGFGNAATCDRTTTGAIAYNSPPAGMNNYLSRFRIDRNTNATTVSGSYILLDRLAHAQIDITSATTAFSPVIDGTARLAAGEGAMIMLEVTVAFSTAQTTWSLDYTNQAGTSGRTTAQLTMQAGGAVINRSPIVEHLFIPFQDGDTGARTIDAWNFVSGTQTGSMAISLVKPLAWMPQTMFLLGNEREFGIMKQFMPQIHPEACLMVGFFPLTNNTNTIMGGIAVVSG